MNTIERLQVVFREVFDDNALRINRNMSKSDIPEWDSVATVRLVLSVEQEFGIHLSTDQVADIRDVASLVQAIETSIKR